MLNERVNAACARADDLPNNIGEQGQLHIVRDDARVLRQASSILEGLGMTRIVQHRDAQAVELVGQRGVLGMGVGGAVCFELFGQHRDFIVRQNVAHALVKGVKLIARTLMEFKPGKQPDQGSMLFMRQGVGQLQEEPALKIGALEVLGDLAKTNSPIAQE
jgi:hypothetical protein